MVARKRKSARIESRIRWWRLKEEERGFKFREEVRQVVGGGGDVLEAWATNAKVLKKTARKLPGGGRQRDLVAELRSLEKYR